MQKMMLVLLILAAVCEISMAEGESQMAVVRHGDVFKVIYKSANLSCVKVSIADKNGAEVFKEELICNQGFIRPYNFSELPKGDYIIQLTDGTDQKNEKIHFDDQPWLAHLMRLSSDEMKIMVAIPHQGVNDFTVQILDRNDRVIYKEDQKIDSEYAKVFNLRKLDRGATVNLVNHITGETKSLVAD